MREKPAGAARSFRVISVSSVADSPHFLSCGSGQSTPGLSVSFTFHHSDTLVTLRCMETLLFGITVRKVIPHDYFPIYHKF